MVTRHFVYIRSVKDFFTLCLLICGDIHPCPGPARKTPQFSCVSCGRAVRHNSKAISCDSCYNWIHLACCPDFSLAEYCELQQSDDDFHYFCMQCLIFELPFNSEPEAGDTDIDVNFLDKEPDEEVK